MEQPISYDALEAAVVRMCAPVLLGAKPANLFTFRGAFAQDCPDCPDEPCGATGAGEGGKSSCDADAIARRRTEFLALICALDARLSPLGMRLRVIAWRPFGALVYGYRPALLARSLGDPGVERDLAQLGYPVGHTSSGLHPEVLASCVPYAPGSEDRTVVERCLVHLEQRFCAHAVPHEVGYFLGYPVCDVRGFIAHEGRGFLCCGCWKVYGDVRGAQRRFARYKRCTRRAQRLYAAGASVVELARDPARRSA